MAVFSIEHNTAIVIPIEKKDEFLRKICEKNDVKVIENDKGEFLKDGMLIDPIEELKKELQLTTLSKGATMTFDEMMEELQKEDPEYWEKVEKGAKAFLADEEADKYREITQNE